MNISDIGEFALIDKIGKAFNTQDNNIIVGIDDDAAALKLSGEVSTLFTTDMLVEDIHFKTSYISPCQLGEKALIVNISDIAAMGGMPRWLLLSLGLPDTTGSDFIEQFCAGASRQSARFGIKLIGGDTVSSSDKIIINVILVGDVPDGEIIRRKGASEGDQIFVTGSIGDSAAGLSLLKLGHTTESTLAGHKEMIMKHLAPSPRVNESRFLAGHRLATAMIDVSDGLIQDLSHICRSSEVRGKIWLDRIPLSEYYRSVSEVYGFDIEHHLTGGEDYELLFTASLEKVEELDELEKKFGCSVTHIGEIVKGEGVSVYDSHNNAVEIKKYGYQHFNATNNFN